MALGKLGTLVAVSALLSPAIATSQTMTAAEILALLQAQREQLNSGNGVARTLEFVTESTPATDPNGVAIVTEIEGDALLAGVDGDAIPESLAIDLTIFFEFDSALLKTESKSQVEALCTAIEASEAAAIAMATESIETNLTPLEGDASSLSALADTVLNNAASAETEATELAELPTQMQSVYQIIGHTDASGSVQYNLSLSQARADEVVRYMVRECGIDGTILEAVGMGEARLKDPSNPRADANRRVEIQVTL